MQVKKTDIIKSPLNFTGGKHKLLPQLLPLFPDDVHAFVDLFCGGCNVAVNVSAEKIICNDKDEKLIGLLDFFRRTTFADLLHEVKKIISDFNLSDSSANGYGFYNCDSSSGLGNFNRSGFFSLRDAFNSSPSDDENYFVMLYVLIVYSFNNQIRFNADGKFNLPVGKRDFNLRMQSKLKSFLTALESKSITFSNNDFAEINPAELSENDFVYADPPYLITCATYNEKNWNDAEEMRLLAYLDELAARNVRFALSNVLSTDNKTNTVLQDWLAANKNYVCHHLDFSYRNSNYHKKDIAETDEVLITNY